ncbi:MAG TPA: hypothetical protein DEF85_03615 [Clostridiaceae bacterium]|jgi:penicillin-binding protein 1A|nr:hypothetical protein [Clostridiaceae bacterium]HBG38680.1 hypothetical protein [Clostridiaceae bacterium]HBN28409.1 hypothetical protein [Clostridiaceae bacterium]HBX47960.1 hypothetical protein [Clostridiaceae bacterium]HCL50066.1 hypothetical protein [Clostridiaceae bacterium]
MDKDNKSSKNKVSKKKKKRNAKKVLTNILIVLLVIIAAGVGFVLATIKSAPTIDTNIIGNLTQSSKITDRDGKVIDSLMDIEAGYRTIVPLKQIPKHVQDAFISIEDERFEQHHGIDIKRIFGAIWHDVRTLSLDQGASTITQQLIKNYALSSEKKFTRKIQEMYLAIQLEKVLSKNEILEAYLNTIHLADNTYGVQAASMHYFGKDVSKISIAQGAVLAAITQYPAKYNPYSPENLKNPEKLLNRQKIVLEKMYELGKINKQQYDEACNEKIVFTKAQSTSQTAYQWFIEPAEKQVAKDFAAKYGISTSEAQQKLRTGGYTIHLTLDQDIQKKAEEAINDDKKYPKIKDSNMSTWASNANDPKLIQPQASAALLDPKTGEVLALVGGRGKHPLLSYNRATDIPRQPGSSIKPISVYAPGIETKTITPATIIDDSPMPDDFVAKNNGWNPQNYDGKFSGNVTVREAIRRSINIPAVKVELMLGANTSIDFLKNKFHISTIVTSGSTNDKNAPALALGGLSKGTTPLEMAAAYGVFVNGGVYSEPYFYTEVTDSKGNVILEKKPNQQRVLSQKTAYIMCDMLKTVIQSGTGTMAKLGPMPAGGKTGTSESHTNGWFAGITPYYSCVVWMGHDSNQYPITNRYWKDENGKGHPATANLDLVGGTCAPIWKEIMLKAHEGLPVKDFTRPSDIVTVKICPASGKVATDKCPNAYNEIFIPGTEPVAMCDIHSISTEPAEKEKPDKGNEEAPEEGKQNNATP